MNGQTGSSRNQVLDAVNRMAEADSGTFAKGAEAFGKGISSIPGGIASAASESWSRRGENLPTGDITPSNADEALDIYKKAVRPSERAALKTLGEPIGLFQNEGGLPTAPVKTEPSYTPVGEGVESNPRWDISGYTNKEVAPGPGGLPFTSEDTAGGGRKYTLAGGEGTLETLGWKPGGKGSFSVMENAGGGIPVKTDAQLELEARRAGTYQGRSLADKEKEMYGGFEPPGEFDHTKFLSNVKSLGVKITPPMMVKLYGQALVEHTAKQNAFNDMVKAKMQFGEGSPQMLEARSRAQQLDIASNIAMAKTPSEISENVAKAMKIGAETTAIPSEIAKNKAYTAYLLSNAENPELKPAYSMLAAAMQAYKEEMDPQRKTAIYNGAIKDFQNFLANRAEKKSPSQSLRAAHPDWDVPDNFEPGKTYHFAPGQTFMYGQDGKWKRVS